MVVGQSTISATSGGLTATLDDNDEFGRSTAPIGDLDGDGVVDLAAGAGRDDDAGTDAGAVYVLFMNADGTVASEQKLTNGVGGLPSVISAGDRFGETLATLGDVDGDGVPDLAVGALQDDNGGATTNAGAVHILLLNPDGTVKSHRKLDASVISGVGVSDYLGESVAGIGDLDGDGVRDLAVGALYDDDGGSNRGAVYILFLGSDGSLKGQQKISDTAGGLTAALDDGDVFGTGIGTVGDVDGDGITDIAVGARNDDDGGANYGAVYVLLLNTDGTVKAEQKISTTTGGFDPLTTPDWFGRSVGALGDLDADGVPDLVVGADMTAPGGSIYVLLLNDNGTVKRTSTIDATTGGLTAVDSGDQFGGSVAGIGDFDGDGTIGIVVGARNDDGGGTDRGAVHLLDLRAVCVDTGDDDADGVLDCYEDADTDGDNNPVSNPGPDTDADTTPDYLDPDDDGDGNPTSAEDPDPNGDGNPRDARDIDRDGQPDYRDTPTRAAEAVVATQQKISSTAGGLTGPLDDSDTFGSGVGPIGDLDGDGVVDLVVGAGTDDDGGGNRGAVHVLFMNADGTVKAEQKISDTTGGLAAALDDGDFFGEWVRSAGDLDGDGRNELVVGARYDDDGGGDRGALHVLFLNSDGTVKAEQKISDTTGGLTATLDDDDGFGVAADGIGDVDGDGVPDIIVGADADDDGGGDRGALYVLFLNTDGTVKAEQKISETTGGLVTTIDADGFGEAVTGPGDIDGDGTPDVAIGMWGDDDDGGPARGAVHILFLNTDGTVKAEQKISEVTGGLGASLDDDDWFGGSVGALGDLDADGVGDLLVGAPGDDDGGTDRGAAYILLLRADGTVKSSAKIADAELASLDDDDWFGIAVSGVGDLDEDGAIDIAVGALYDDDGGSNRGAVYLIDLQTSCIDAGDDDADGVLNCYEDADTDGDGDPSTTPGPDTDGDTSADYVDSDDDGDGDLTVLENADPNGDGNPRDAVDGDHDGQPDYLDGPTGTSGGLVADEVKISGTTGGLTASLDAFDLFGQGAAPVGDLDGDGVVDLAVGAYQDDDGGSNRGAVHLLFLNPDGTVKAEQKISEAAGGGPGLDDSDQFGRNVAHLGDLDGDGLSDIAVGAFRDDDGGTNRGAVYIAFLNADGTARAIQKVSATAGGFTGPLADGVEFGRDVAGLGDVDGDGVVDIAVGSTQDNDGGTDRGAVHVLFLNPDGTVKAEQKISDTTGGLTTALDDDDEFGLGLAGIGDLDGDGVADLAVGAHKDDDGAADAGALYILFLNADGTVKAEQKISSTSGGLGVSLETVTAFGAGVTAIGDLDLDGNVDLAVGAPYDDDGENYAGAVYILFLDDDGTVRAADKISAASGAFTGPLDNFDNLGFGLAPLGDLDGDGTINLAVGANGDDDGANSAGAVYILDLADACTLGTGYGEACPFTALAQVADDLDGRFWFDFGDGAFQASVSSDEGGAWVQILQYNHEGGTNPNVDARSAGEHWPASSAAPLGTDQSAQATWGHIGQAAAAAIPDADADLELRWYGETSNHSRVVHFRSPLLGEIRTDGADDFFAAGLATTHVPLTGHTADAPASIDNGYDGQGDLVLTSFPWYETGTRHWGIRGLGYRWEVDDYANNADNDTLHRVWIRVRRPTVVVNSTGDGADANTGDGICSTGGTNIDGDPECTLRAAIAEANASTAVGAIDFAIPTADGGHDGGVWTIATTSELPTITGTVDIDGTSQVGYATPVVTVDGSGQGSGRGLTLTASDATIRGLNVRDMPHDGIYVGGARNTIADNHLGTDAAGLTGAGNARAGVEVGGIDNVISGNVSSGNGRDGIIIRNATRPVIIGNHLGPDVTGDALIGQGQEGIQVEDSSVDVVIGRPGDGNVISGNSGGGIHVFDGTPDRLILQGNLIGVGADGATSMPNALFGIRTRPASIDWLIGGTGAGEGNTIADNSGPGIRIDDAASTGISVVGNRIHDNTGIGLDLGSDGVTANDAGDADTGANELLNTPVVARAIESGGTVTVEATLDAPAGDYRIEAFINPSGPDDTGYGEGEVVAGNTSITHTGTGAESFSLIFSGAAGDVVSLIATEDLGGGDLGSSSEFSGNGLITDTETLVVNATGDDTDATAGDGRCDSGAANALGAPACTLRAAITEANASAGIDTIVFHLPAAEPGHSGGVWTISPTGSLMPPITSTTTIDATTQPGFVDRPVVGVNGAGIASGSSSNDGLTFQATAPGSAVVGLAVYAFADESIVVSADNTTITGNFFGAAPDESIPAHPSPVSSRAEVYLIADGITFGGSDPGDGNLIASPTSNESLLLQFTFDGTVVEGNRFGTTFDGSAQLGTGSDRTLVARNTTTGLVIRDNRFAQADEIAISVEDNSTATVVGNVFGTDEAGTAVFPITSAVQAGGSAQVRFGGTGANDGNLVRNAGDDAVVHVGGATGTLTVLGNDIAGSGGLGIDLEGGTESTEGVTANDGGDGDTGANGLLNRPVATSVAESGGTLTVGVDLDVPAGDYRLEFFTNPTAGPDPSGSGEGETLVHAEVITHSGSGTESFAVAFAGNPSDHITATATEDLGGGAYGATSEFSTSITMPLVVNATGDGSDATPGDGFCDTGGTAADGDDECTLRAALEEANAAAHADTITFDVPTGDGGHDSGVWTITPAAALPVIDDPVTIDGSTQSGYGSTPVIEIDGRALSTSGIDGLRLSSGSDGSTIRALAVYGLPSNPLEIDGGDGHLIVGNHLGTAASGLSVPAASAASALHIASGGDLTIGGTAAGDGNLLAGGDNGIVIDGSGGVDGVAIEGNRIGTDVTGNTELGVAYDGIRVQDGAADVVIGGSTAGSGNVIAGTGSQGVQISGEATDGVVIEGNSIGVGLDGTTALTIGREGIQVIDGGDGISITDNIIGNVGDEGIEFDGDTVGGTVQGNRIGLDGGGAPHPVSSHGILIDDAAGTPTGILIGGTGAGEGNRMANTISDGDGIRQLSTGDNAFLGNRITASDGLAVDLGVDGVTVNDAGDVDDGPNGLLNHPEITDITESGGTLTVDYDLDVPAGDYRVEFFTNDIADASGHGEAQTLAQATSITHTGSGTESFSVAFTGTAADVVAATATVDVGGGSYGATSEVSGSASVTVVVNSTADSDDANPGDGVCSTATTNADGDPECTLRAAITEANASAVVRQIEFSIPTTDGGHSGGHWTISPSSQLPTVTGAVRIDGTSQPGYSANTTAAPLGLDQLPIIGLDGSSAGTADGLVVGAADATVAGLRIGGFDGDGIVLDGTRASITAVSVGVDAAGAVAFANTGEGIVVNAADATIGGPAAADRVLISGNDTNGVRVDGQAGTTVDGAIIGLDAAADAVVPNGANGVRLGNATGATVRDSVISGNDEPTFVADGIFVTGGSGHRVQGNHLGTNADGDPLGNFWAGIAVSSATDILIGGTGVDEGNVIASNGSSGVIVQGTSTAAVLGNAISANDALGIDLDSDGVTANDDGDADTGPNDLLNFPVIDSATIDGGTVTIGFSLDAPAGDYRIEFFANPAGADGSGHGEGGSLVHTALGTHTGSGVASFTTTYAGSFGQVLTATATEDLGGGSHGATSEFSAAATVVAETLTVNATADDGDASPGDGVCDTGGTNSEGDPECTLRAVLEEVDGAGGDGTRVEFAIPTSDPGYSTGPTAFTLTPTSPLPAVTRQLVIDGASQSQYATLPVIVLDGSAAGTGADGLRLRAGADLSTINALTIHSFGQAALDVRDGDGHTITGNVLGLMADGDTAAGNTYGLYAHTSVGLTIGGTTAAERNVISGNEDGVRLDGNSTDAVIVGNHIGTDAAGLVDRGNQLDAIHLAGNADRARIGGSTATERNVLAGSGDDAINAAAIDDLVIEGNHIGVGADGVTPLGNSGAGIELNWGRRATVTDNVVGPGNNGIVLGNHDDAVITGNSIGTDPTGIETWAIGQNAVVLRNGTENALIGGTTTAEANLIRNAGVGGVVLESATDTGNAVIGNSIAANTGLGIDLGDDGRTANDAGDVDSGANDLLNHPAISRSVETAPGTLTTTIELDVPAGTYRIEVFRAQDDDTPDDGGAGEGQTLLGSSSVVHTGSGSETFTVTHDGAAGHLVAATATDDTGGGSYGSTSEFSRARTALATDEVAVNDGGDGGDLAPGDGVCDSGGVNAEGATACTLRAAIEELNGAGGIDTIRFDLPAADLGHSSGVWTISPGSALPSMNESVTLDATTQPGWADGPGTPVVELDGASAGASANGLDVNAPASTVRGLAIGNFDRTGLEVSAGSTAGTVIAGNHIGTDASGLVDRGNGFFGVHLQGGSTGTTIGGTDVADRNVISGNDDVGVTIQSDDNVLLNNFVGTDATGLAALPNDNDGIRMTASAQGNTIGQTGAGNVLSGNTSDGIEAKITVTDNTIRGNLIGLGADGDTVVANGRHGIILFQSDNNVIGGTGAGDGNVISGNGQRGVVVDSDNIAAATANRIIGNRIGTDATGTLARDNTDEGVLVMRGATATVIGGSTVAHGNVISGNTGVSGGILITDSATAGTVVQHNRIGTDATGTVALANGGFGLSIQDAPDTDVLDNLISGNVDDGIRIDGAAATGTELYRNLVGVDAVGTTALANGGDGIEIGTGAEGTVTGAPGDGNVLSGNVGHGLHLAGADATVIRANHIGTDGGATIDLGNGGDGVAFTGARSSDTVIGGTGSGEGNTITGNAVGVSVADGAGSGHAVLGNRIHDSDALGIDLVGGAEDAAGVTANDGGDVDTGPNDLLNHPVIENVQRVDGDLVAEITLDVAAGDHRIELFANTDPDPDGYGEGETPLGGATVTHTGGGAETFTVSVTSAATVLTATATEDLGGGVFGSTSEFSAAVPSPDLVVVNSTGDADDAVTGDGQCDTGATNADGDPECTLRAALAEADDPTTPVDTIWFALPTGDGGFGGRWWTVSLGADLPAIVDPVTIDATTQTGYAGTPLVVLDATGTSGDVFRLRAATTVAGLSFVGGPADAIRIGAAEVTVHSSYLGLDPDGTTGGFKATGSDGIVVDTGSTTGVMIGGQGQGNRIEGFGGNGVVVRLGGAARIEANTITGNGADGVLVSDAGASADTAVVGNAIAANGGLAIDLAGGGETADGVTANDVGDIDTGPNGLLNTPVIRSVTADAGWLTIELGLDVPAGTYRLDAFTNPGGADPSGSGELEQPAGTATIVHPGGGEQAFTVVVPGTAGAPVTANVTLDQGADVYGATSEASGPQTVVDASAATVEDLSVRRSDTAARGGLDPSSTATSGTAGSAVGFDGGGDRLLGPALDLVDTELTVAAWVRADVLTGTDVVVSKGGADGPVYELAVEGATGNAVATIDVAGGVTVRGGTLSTGAWHQLAAVWDGTDLVLYVDGTEVDRTGATGSLSTDVDTPLVVGNDATGGAGFDGLIDHVLIEHRPTGPDHLLVDRLAAIDADSLLTVGEEQSGVPDPWTVTTDQARSGTRSLLAPETPVGTGAAWATAPGFDEPGWSFTSWWYLSTADGVDLGVTNRASETPADGFEAAVVSAAGLELRHRTGGTTVVDAPADGAPATGGWVKVELQTDQDGNSRLLLDGVEVTGWTAQGADPSSGSIGLRTGLLPGGERWYVDDPQARKLVTPEPTATLGPLDRD
ncbi:MAG: right-handed parallel beta-helix repeat-containing protein [Actinomycetota bacterium]